MKPLLDFVVFADSHLGVYEGSVIDESGLNGRLMDGLKVWDEVFEYASSKRRKVVVYLGDRFRSCNPKGYVRDLADEKLKRFANNFIFIVVVGNHDYYEKSSYYHSYGVAHLFDEELQGLKLFDTPAKFGVDGVMFWGLPHGRSMDEFYFGEEDFDSNFFNVLLFHHDVVGAVYPSGMKVDKGLSAEEFRKFDLVLGGHIHMPQPIAGCRGGFIGSVQQLKRDDEGFRGYWDCRVSDKSVKVVEVESGAPKYVEETVELKNGDEWKKFLSEEKLKNRVKGQYLILKGVGNKSVLKTVDRSSVERELIDGCGLRFCTFEANTKESYEFKMPELRESKNKEEEVDIALNKMDLQGLDKKELRRVGLDICREASQ